MRSMSLYLPEEMNESDFNDFLISIKANEINSESCGKTEKRWNYCFELGEWIYDITLDDQWDFDLLNLSIHGKDEFVKFYLPYYKNTEELLEDMAPIEQELSKVKEILGTDPKGSIWFSIGNKGDRAAFNFVRELRKRYPFFAVDYQPGFRDNIISVEKFMSLKKIYEKWGAL